MTSTQVVIVGAGLGGLRTAESLRSAGFDRHLVIVGDEPHLPYNRPPLSKEALAGGVTVEDLHFRRRSSLDNVEWRLGSPACSSDLKEGTVALADGTVLPFAGLVIASGIRPRQLPIPGPTKGRFLLRNAENAAELRRVLKPGIHMVIMGAGFIGCEVAATARQLGAEVDVVALDQEPMVRPLGLTFGASMRQHHERNGVHFHMGRTVQEILGSDQVTGVRLDNGIEISATVVLEAVGSAPNVEWLERNNLDLTDGVLVNEALQVIGSEAPCVAVGDIARHPNALFPGGPWRVEHWNMPSEMAKFAGRSLAQALHGARPASEVFSALPAFWSDQYTLNIQSYGMPALGDPVLADGEWGGNCIVEYVRNARLVGVVGINRARDLMEYRKRLLTPS